VRWWLAPQPYRERAPSVFPLARKSPDSCTFMLLQKIRTQVESCAEGYDCVPWTAAIGERLARCQRHPRLGEPCVLSDRFTWQPRCPRGSYCDGVCRPLTVPSAIPGAPCTELLRCDPSERLFCNDSGACERATGVVGSICNERERPYECLAGNYCVIKLMDLGAEVRCAAARPDGEACEYWAECLSTSCEDGLCIPAVCE